MKVSLILGVSIGDIFVNSDQHTIISLFWIMRLPLTTGVTISRFPTLLVGKREQEEHCCNYNRMKIWSPRKREGQWGKARKYWERNEWGVQDSWKWVSGDTGNNLNDSTLHIQVSQLLHFRCSGRVQPSLSVVAYIFIRKTTALMWYDISIGVSRLNSKIIWMPLKWAPEPFHPASGGRIT